MFASIRRHSKWLWFIIVVGVIVSFVFFFTPQQGGGGFSRGGGAGDVIGRIGDDTVTREEYTQALKESRLRFKLFSGNWPDETETSRMLYSREREAQEIQRRLFLIQQLDKLGIEVGDAAVAEWITEVFRDREGGGFQMELYQAFVEDQLNRRGYSERDFKRFVQHEVGIQHLIALFGMPGKLVPPQEAEIQFRLENEEVDTQVAFFRLSDYSDQVQLEPPALKQYFTNNQANYRIPDQRQVAYVPLNASNYTAQAEQTLAENPNLDQILQSIYEQRGTNAYPDVSAAEAKQRIREELLTESSLIEAQKAAINLIEALMEKEGPPAAKALEEVAQEKGLTVEVSPPFSRFEQPAGLQVPPTFSQRAFDLTQEQPFTLEPVLGPEAIYVMAIQTNIPSRLPPFEEVESRVTEDYKRDQARQLARRAGEEFRAAVAEGVDEGKNLLQVAQEKNVPAVDLPPFSQPTTTLPELPNRANFSALKNTAFELGPSGVSAFTPTSDGGFIVYLEKRVPVSDEKTQEELGDYLAALRRSQQFETFEAWLQSEMAQTPMSLPGEQRVQN